MGDGKPDGVGATQILHQEYLRCCGEVERLLTQNEKVVQFGTLVGGGLLYTSYSTQVPLLHLLVPITLVGLFLYLVNVHEFAMVARGYVAHLEKAINEQVGEKVLRWENEAAKTVTHYRYTTVALVAIGLCVCIGASAASFRESWQLLAPRFDRHPALSAFYFAYVVVWAGLLAFALIKVCRLGGLRDSVTRKFDKPGGAAPQAVSVGK